MKKPTLVVAAVVLAVVPALVSVGCNKKEDAVPAPTAAPATPPPPAPTTAVVPSPAQPVAPAPQPTAIPAKTVAIAKTDSGAREAGATAALPDAATPGVAVAIPPVPTLHPSALPGIASGIVGGIIGALPSGVVIPPVPSR